MKEITAYQCSDGLIFSSEEKAAAHDEDLLGQELDGLLRLFELDITKNQEYKALICAMKKRKELKSALTLILKIIKHSENEE
jgi:hypothetical protein